MADPKVTLVVRARDMTRGVLRGIGRNLTQLGGAIAAAFTAVKLVEFGKDALVTARNLRNLADGLNLTRGEFQALADFMRKFGADADDVSDAMFSIQQARSEAMAVGGESMSDEFAKLGITMRELQGTGNPLEIFLAISQALKDAGDNAFDLQDAVSRIMGEDNARRMFAALRQGPQAILSGLEESFQSGRVRTDRALDQAAAVTGRFANELEEASVKTAEGVVVLGDKTIEAAEAIAEFTREMREASIESQRARAGNTFGFDAEGGP